MGIGRNRGYGMIGWLMGKARGTGWFIKVAFGLGMLLAPALQAQSPSAIPITNGPIVTPYNTPAINAPVRVCLASSVGTPCSTTGVTLYSDANLTQKISNPASTNSNGIYGFYINASQYTLPQFFYIQITISSTVTYYYQFLATVASGIPSIPVPVAQGGSGMTSLTPYAPLFGGTSSTSPMQSLSSLGTSGQALISGGSSALPAYGTLGIGGGGTGATTQAGAFTNIVGPGGIITGPFSLTTPLGIASGGSGQTTANAAMTAFGITQTGTIGTSSQSDTVTGSFAANSFILPASVTVASGQSIAQAVAVLIAKSPSGGVVNVPIGSFASGATSEASCIQAANISIVGAQEPVVSSDQSQLQGGSIILGPIAFCGANHSMSNLGVDQGPAYVTGGGATYDGISGQPPTYTSSTPLLPGDTLDHVIVLMDLSVANVHAIRCEHETGVYWKNVALVNTGGHGFTVKSQNVVVDGFTALGCTTDCTITTSDGNTPLVTNVVWINGVENDEGIDVNGNVVGTEGASVTSHVSYSNIHVTLTSSYGTPGFLVNNDNGGNGAVHNVTVSNATVTVSNGGHQFALSASTNGYSSDQIIILGSTFNNVTTTGLSAPLEIESPFTNSFIYNFTSYCGTYASEIEGTVTVNGFYDQCGTTYTQPSIVSSAAATVLNLYNLTSNRVNPPPVASGGSTINIFPNLSALWVVPGTSGLDLQTGGNFTASGNLTAKSATTSTVIQATNTGTGSAYVNAASGNTFSAFQSITSAQTWATGMFGNTNWALQNTTKGTTWFPIQVSASAPEASLSILATGQPLFGFLNTGTAGCLQADSGGNVSNTNIPCVSTVITGSNTIAATATNYLMSGSVASSGMLHVRDNTSGGSALFLIDPNGGSQLIGTSQITGLSAAQILWDQSCTGCANNWSIALSTGTVPRSLVWTIYQ